MHHYELHNYSECNEYVNSDSVISNLDEVWTTQIPNNYTTEDEQPTKPYAFSKRGDAVFLLDQLKSHRLDDWRRHEHTYRAMGKRKPTWKVYKVVA